MKIPKPLLDSRVTNSCKFTKIADEYDAQIVGNRITEVLVFKTFQTLPFAKVDHAPLQATLRSLLIQNASEYLQEDQLDQDHQGAPVKKRKTFNTKYSKFMSLT